MARTRSFHLILHRREARDATSLRTMKRRQLMEYHKVPGYIKKSNAKPGPRVGHLNGKGRRVVNGMKNLVLLMHKKGLTLNGNYNLRNLAYVSGVCQVKFKRISHEDFLPFTPEAGDNDFKSLGVAVEEMLENCDIPSALKDWIDLLKSFAIENLHLVEFHVALRSAEANIFHYIHLFGLYEQLQIIAKEGDAESAAKYNSIVNSVPLGDTTKDKDWKSDIFCNSYLIEVYQKHQGDYTKTTGASALLLFGRNSTQHLMEKLAKNEEIRLRYAVIYWILEGTLPGIFFEFQYAMVSSGVEDFGCHEG